MTEIFDEYGNYIFPTDVTDIRTDVTSILAYCPTSSEPSMTIHLSSEYCNALNERIRAHYGRKTALL